MSPLPTDRGPICSNQQEGPLDSRLENTSQNKPRGAASREGVRLLVVRRSGSRHTLQLSTHKLALIFG